MEDVQFSFPNIVAIEKLSDVGAAKLATDVKLVQSIVQFNSNGVVTKDATWGIDKNGNSLCPGAWAVVKQSTGNYKVTHSLGWADVTLSVFLFQSPGTITVVENAATYFVVSTMLNGAPCDMPWGFSLGRIISP